MTKENIDFKTRLEWAANTLRLAEKSKSGLKRDLNQANTGLGEKLRKVKVLLKKAEESKAMGLDFLARDNADLRNALQETKNESEQQELDDAKRGKAAEFLAKENTDL